MGTHKATFWAIFNSQPCFQRRMGEWVGFLLGLCSHINFSLVVSVPTGNLTVLCIGFNLPVEGGGISTSVAK